MLNYSWLENVILERSRIVVKSTHTSTLKFNLTIHYSWKAGGLLAYHARASALSVSTQLQYAQRFRELPRPPGSKLQLLFRVSETAEILWTQLELRVLFQCRGHLSRGARACEHIVKLVTSCHHVKGKSPSVF